MKTNKTLNRRNAIESLAMHITDRFCGVYQRGLADEIVALLRAGKSGGDPDLDAAFDRLGGMLTADRNNGGVWPEPIDRLGEWFQFALDVARDPENLPGRLGWVDHDQA